MEDDKQKMIDEVNTKLKELNELDMLEQLLKDNINEFVFKTNHYRVRKPNAIEKEAANKERMKRYLEMLKDPVYLFRKTLVSMYKTKGIDIDGMDRDIKNAYLQEQNYLKRLNGNEDPKDIELFEQEIAASRQLQQDLFLQKDDLLKYCIEQQLDDFLKMYLIYLVLEVKKENQWDKVYSSFEQFMQSSDDLLQAKAAQVFAVMIYHENI